MDHGFGNGNYQVSTATELTQPDGLALWSHDLQWGQHGSDVLNHGDSTKSLPTYRIDTVDHGFGNGNYQVSTAAALREPDGLALWSQDLQWGQHEAGPLQFDCWTFLNLEAPEEFSLNRLLQLDYPSRPACAVDLESDMHLTANGPATRDPGLESQCEHLSHVTSHPQKLVEEDEQHGMQLGNGVEDVELTGQLENVKDDQLAVRGENLVEDGHQQFDMLKEKDLIVKRMIGYKLSVDPSLEENLNYFVGVHQSLRTGVPQHCQRKCNPINDPADCCWNTKFSKAQPNFKTAFQREITSCVNVYLKGHKKKLSKLPVHCTRALSAWTKANFDVPYMPRTLAENKANEWGLTVIQINHWLENWRTRKWNPIPTGQRGRKGTKFPHIKEDSTKIRNWLLKEQRHPSQEEAELLSIGTCMTPNQILTYCFNFRKRNKSHFKNWQSNKSRRSISRIEVVNA